MSHLAIPVALLSPVVFPSPISNKDWRLDLKFVTDNAFILPCQMCLVRQTRVDYPISQQSNSQSLFVNTTIIA